MRAVVGGIEDVEGKGTELAEAVIQEDGGGLLTALESQGDTTSKGWQVGLSNGRILHELLAGLNRTYSSKCRILELLLLLPVFDWFFVMPFCMFEPCRGCGTCVKRSWATVWVSDVQETGAS
jgi:hypothetical protein